uniref:Uncharacterized protein n=1 Tax=Oryza glaberrima TaxID=4538 RepID=I1QBS1_ORYGL
MSESYGFRSFIQLCDVPIESRKVLELHVFGKLRRESKVPGLWELVGVDEAMAIAMEADNDWGGCLKKHLMIMTARVRMHLMVMTA